MVESYSLLPRLCPSWFHRYIEFKELFEWEGTNLEAMKGLYSALEFISADTPWSSRGEMEVSRGRQQKEQV